MDGLHDSSIRCASMVPMVATVGGEPFFREVATPWMETNAMYERQTFVRDAPGDPFTLAEVCCRYGGSHLTGCNGARKRGA
jgi:hypothetical protein